LIRLSWVSAAAVVPDSSDGTDSGDPSHPSYLFERISIVHELQNAPQGNAQFGKGELRERSRNLHFTMTRIGHQDAVVRDEGNRVGARKRALVSRGGCALAALSCGFSLWVKAAEIASMPVLEGSAAYRVNCANCHGENLSGGYGPSLRDMAFRTKWTSLGPAALREFLSTRMPPSDPGGLAQDMYEQIATFIEQTSGIATTPPPAKQNESTTELTDPARPSDRRGV
jgi:mono/diheme cytochrome c family protein